MWKGETNLETLKIGDQCVTDSEENQTTEEQPRETEREVRPNGGGIGLLVDLDGRGSVPTQGRETMMKRSPQAQEVRLGPGKYWERERDGQTT